MKIQKVLGWSALGLGLVTVATEGLSLHEQSLEQPIYAVVEKDGAFELRDYPSVLVTQTTVIGERRLALRTGFKRLADYIFGNQKEKIEMTAPVFSDGAKGAWRTSFVMPSRFTATTLPSMPAGLTATELPARRMAVIRFSGIGNDAQLAERESRLRDWLAKRSLNATGDAVAAFYNSPFVLPPFRRNEIMIMVQ